MADVSITREKMIEEALRRGWQVTPWGPEDFFYVITRPEGKQCMYRGSMPQEGAWMGNYIARHKLVSSAYVSYLGYNTVPCMEYTDEASAAAFLHEHQPIVVKPEDAEKSQGVTVGITSVEQLSAAVEAARKYSPQVILQKQLQGRLYRILVIGGTFCAATHRRAAFVTGDSTHTVRELIEEKNKNPLRTPDGKPLTKIPIEAAGEFIGVEVLDQVLEPGKEIVLSAIDSLSMGGEGADVTDIVHDDLKHFSEKIAQSLSLPSCGLDVMTPDISQPLNPTDALPILEINSMPGFKMHYYPTAGGEPRNVAATLLDYTLGKV